MTDEVFCLFPLVGLTELMERGNAQIQSGAGVPPEIPHSSFLIRYAPDYMIMDLEIVKATPDDVADIKKIEDECFSVPWSEKSIEESLKNPCSHFYIAKVNNETAGYIGVQIFSGEGYVTNVATLPEYRKQGIARALMETALRNEM